MLPSSELTPFKTQALFKTAARNFGIKFFKKKLFLERNLTKQMSNPEKNTLKNAYLSSFIQNNTVWNFETKSASKNVFPGWNLRKQLSNTELGLLKIPRYRVSIEKNLFEISESNLPNNGTDLGTKLKSNTYQIQNLQLWILLCTRPHLKYREKLLAFYKYSISRFNWIARHFLYFTL